MPAVLQDRILVPCPHCGHSQPEPRTAFSTVCRKCGQHYRVQEILRPEPRAAETGPEQRRVQCFDCGTELLVAATAESTMCKRCSRYVDLKDYVITSAVSKNFRTLGRFVIEPRGYVFNTDANVGDAVIKGRLLGTLTVTRTLTICSTAEIKGAFSADRLIIPPENHFRWSSPIRAGSAEIDGELSADLELRETAILRSTARFFGSLQAAALCIEPGAVVVGAVKTSGG
ncbi:MAG: polymer-forming cytoskeletal protein [Verrucomicrobiota bacterium]